MSEKEQDQNAEKPSKTQRKKAMHHLQELGEELINLPKSKVSQIAMPEQLHAAIQFARTLKTHESKRRQLQYIGKLMRNVDVEPIIQALKNIKLHDEQYTAQFHEAEKWRDTLITLGDEGLKDFFVRYPQVDKQKLRQLIRKAQFDHVHDKNSGAKTELFRFLRELIKV